MTIAAGNVKRCGPCASGLVDIDIEANYGGNHVVVTLFCYIIKQRALPEFVKDQMICTGLKAGVRKHNTRETKSTAEPGQGGEYRIHLHRWQQQPLEVSQTSHWVRWDRL
jgi:hypothetical protein